MEFPSRTAEPRDEFGNGYFTNQALKVGFSSVNPGPMPLPPMVMSGREFLLEELRKEQMREEALAMEIAEKRLVEDEIRRETDYERQLAIRRLEQERSLPIGGEVRAGVVGFGERVGRHYGFMPPPPQFEDVSRVVEGSGVQYREVGVSERPVVVPRLNAEFSGYREDEIVPLRMMPHFNDSRVDEGPLTRYREIEAFERPPIMPHSNTEFSGYRDDHIALPPVMPHFHDVRVDDGPMTRYGEVESLERQPAVPHLKAELSGYRDNWMQDQIAQPPVMPHFHDVRAGPMTSNRDIEAFARPPAVPYLKAEFSGYRDDEIALPPVMPHFVDNRVDEGSMTRYRQVEAIGRPPILQEPLDVMEGLVKPQMKFSGNKTERSSDHIVLCAAKKVKRKATTELCQPPQGAKRKETTELSQQPPSKEWCCPLCQVTTTSQKTLNIHLSGKKHQAKQAELNLKAMPKGANASKHQAKQAELNLKATPREANAQTELNLEATPKKPNASKHQAVGSSSKKLAENDKEENLQQGGKSSKIVWCKVCNLQCNSLAMMDSHLKGKKHKARLEGKGKKKNSKIENNETGEGNGENKAVKLV